ncbi:MAG: copper chaperone PCu(A)C [Gammaproteobacteria bacterium]|nr:copper chaperone PCu(A)C [Gammaproteobacteria bacterium]
MKVISRVFSCLLLFNSFPLTAHAGDLQITHAWVADAPPVASVRAGYMTIKNTSNKEQIIVAVTSSDFSNVSFHQTVVRDSMVFMNAMHQFIIPAHDELKLQPGSYHLMLFKARKKLTPGNFIDITLRTKKGQTINTQAPIKKIEYKPSTHNN